MSPTATTADLQYLVKVQDAQLKKLISDVRATNRLIAQTGTTAAAAGAEASAGFRKMDTASTAAGTSVVRTGRHVRESEGMVKRFGESVRSLGKIAVLASGIGGLIGLERGVSAVAEATHNFEATQASLKTQLQTSGLSWAKYRGEIIDTLDAQGNLASFSRNDLEQSFTQLLRTTGSVTDALKLNALAVNLARGAHLILDQSAKVVSRVYSGNVGILKRYGIVLGANVKTPLQALIALQAKFSGQGAAFGRTTAGEIQRLQNSVGLLAIDFSEGLVPALSEAFTSLNLFATDRKTEARVHELGKEFGHFLGGEIKSTIGWFKANWPSIEDGLTTTISAARAVARTIGSIRDALNGLGIPVGPGTLIELFVGYKLAKFVGGTARSLVGLKRALIGVEEVQAGQSLTQFLLGIPPASKRSEGALAGLLSKLRLLGGAGGAAAGASEASVALEGVGGAAAGAAGAEGVGALTVALGPAGLGVAAAAGIALVLNHFGKLDTIKAHAKNDLAFAGKQFDTFASHAVADLDEIGAAADSMWDRINRKAHDLPGSSFLSRHVDDIKNAARSVAENTPGFGPAVHAIEGLNALDSAAQRQALKDATTKMDGEANGLRHAAHAHNEHAAAASKDAKAHKALFDSINKGFHVPEKIDPAVAQATRQLGFNIKQTKSEFGDLRSIVDRFPAAFGPAFGRAIRKVGQQVAGMVDQDDVDRVQARLDQMMQGLQARLASFQSKLAAQRSNFESAWGTFADKALQAFDAETTRLESKLSVLVRMQGESFRIRDGGQTPAERELAALQRIDQLRQSRRDLGDAKANLAAAQATGDPNLIKAAQRALEDAQTQVREQGLEKRAERERKAADKALARRKKEFEAQRQLEREHFQQELDMLEKRLESGKESQKRAQQDILNLFRRYHISYQQAGQDLGSAFATGMHESFAAVTTDIGRVNKAFQRLVSFRGPLQKLTLRVSQFANAMAGFDPTPHGGAGGAGGAGPNGNGTGLAGRLVNPHEIQSFTQSKEQRGQSGWGHTPAQAQMLAKNALLKLYGMGGPQWTALQKLWTRESGWRWNATNPKSGAYGIPQALPPSKMGAVAPDWRKNAATQILWGLGYIRSRYGTPAKAWQHEQKIGWYETGGVAPGLGLRDTVPAMLTPGEVVLNAKQQRGLARRLGSKAAPGRQLFSEVQHFADGGVVDTRRRKHHGPPPPPPPPWATRKDIRQLPELVRHLERLEAKVDRHGGNHLPGIIPLLRALEARWAARGSQDKIKGVVQAERRLWALFGGKHKPGEFGSPIKKLLALIQPGRLGHPHKHHDTPDDHPAAGTQVSTVLQRAHREAQRVSRLELPYVLGGGHSTPAPPNGPFDCSSFVSRVLQVAGFQIPTMVSSGFLNWAQPGRGRLETLARPGLGIDGHVYMKIGRDYYGTSITHHDGGPGLLSYGERSGFRIRHPKGFMFGGEVPGFGIHDRIPALLTPGERVFTRTENQELKRVAVGAGGGGEGIVWTGDLIVQGNVVTERDLLESIHEGLKRKASRQALPKRGPNAGKRIGLA